jgi:hypothetical protein
MVESDEEICTMVQERFSRIAGLPGQEKRFPVGPGSAKKQLN